MLLRGDGAPSVVQTVNAISGGEDLDISPSQLKSLQLHS